MCIERHVSQTLEDLRQQFPAVLVTGARQVGKSTLLKHIACEDYSYITFDNPMIIEQVKADPRLFLLDHPGKLILDEIQLAPELFPYLKMEIDRIGEPGMYLLSGSQAFHLMENVSETLAGRIAILNLAGLSQRELGNAPYQGPFIPSHEKIVERSKLDISNAKIWEFICQGSYPQLHSRDTSHDVWYSSYSATYVERDVRQMINIEDSGVFMRFLSSVAARSGELLNLSAIAKDIGKDSKTVASWFNILEASGVIYVLRPWYNNHLNRALKTAKIYFMDTGLLAWLTRWPSADTIRTGAQAGQFFETYIISEIVKSFFNAGIIRPDLYFYRDKDKREIDLIIQDARTLYPVEINMTAAPTTKMAKNFRLIPELAKADNLQVGTGTILCQYPDPMHLSDTLLSLPVQYL